MLEDRQDAKAQRLFAPIPDDLDFMGKKIVDCAFQTHKTLGPGLTENIHDAQILAYMTLMKLRLGYLINFNVPLIKNGIKRKVM